MHFLDPPSGCVSGIARSSLIVGERTLIIFAEARIGLGAAARVDRYDRRDRAQLGTQVDGGATRVNHSSWLHKKMRPASRVVAAAGANLIPGLHS
jgi:hypothetical protein